MALPDNRTEWPPNPFKKVYDKTIADWSMWWEGTSTRLTTYNSGQNTMPRTDVPLSKRIPMAYDTLTGKQAATGTTQAETRIHSPLFADICRMMAALAWATPPSFVFPVEDQGEELGDEEDFDADEAEDEIVPDGPIDTKKKPDPKVKLKAKVPPKPGKPAEVAAVTDVEPEVNPITGEPKEPEFSEAEGIEETVITPEQARLDLLANNPVFHRKMFEAAETQAALGGVYVRVVWDEDVWEDRAFLDVVDADHAVPEFKWDRLVGVTFWEEFKGDKDIVYRWFQHYTKGFIEHAVYEGTAVDVGNRVPLTDVKRTAHLGTPDEYGEILVDEEGKIATGDPDNLAAVYIPFKTNNPAWRHDNQLKQLGTSALTNDVLPWLSAVDEAWSSLMRDMRQGLGKVIISESLLEVLGAGAGTYFNMAKEIYAPVAEALDADGKPVIEQVQFSIRVEDHLGIVLGLVKEVIKRVGLSPLTFGISESVATTATEIKANTRDTSTTQEGLRRYWGPELSHILTVLMRVDAEQFDTGVVVEENIEVEWPPAIEDSELEIANIIAAWSTAGIASLETMIRKAHPDWDDTRVKKEITAIEEKKKADAPPIMPMPFEAGEGGPEGGLPIKDEDDDV